MSAEIANTILNQLGGKGRVGVMIGVKHFIDLGNGVGIRFAAKAKQGCNHVEVRLDPSDTYTLTFSKVTGLSAKLLATESDVYAEDLIRFFELQTGLFLHF